MRKIFRNVNSVSRLDSASSLFSSFISSVISSFVGLRRSLAEKWGSKEGNGVEAPPDERAS